MRRAVAVVAVAVALGVALGAACGGEPAVGAADADGAVLVPPDVAVGVDGARADATAEGDDGTVAATDGAGAADVAEDAASPVDAAAGDSDDAAVDGDDAAVDGDGAGEVPAVVTCPSPSLLAQYPPPMPPFPYGAWPPADGCFAAEHDVVIVLGCPSEGDGSPASCQTKRAELADLLYESHWASHFIVTGAAVHNQWVEADALFDLLVGRGIPADAIVKEPLAEHTDENIYYATRIMQDRSWRSAIVVSDDPAHLMYTGLCDADCCVRLGRMTLLGFPVEGVTVVNAGHYALTPPGPDTSADECTHLASLALCSNLDQRRACKDDFQLEAP